MQFDKQFTTDYTNGMERFFDFPPSLWEYFQQVDGRLAARTVVSAQSGPLEPYWGDLHGIRAVLWDVYGTLCGAAVGDLEQSLVQEGRLQSAARATIAEFELGEALARLYPDTPGDLALRDRYLELIGQSHKHSEAAGVEYPEVVIENIWLTILRDCCGKGYQPFHDEPIMNTAYRIAYFFDAQFQQMFLYQGINKCLRGLKNAGIIQGIISNAQFYTPIHLRRLLRLAEQNRNLELDEFFSEGLMFFSYELGYSKPNTAAFQQARDKLGLEGIAQHEICYIGNDMLKDIRPALSVGMRAVLFAGDQDQVVSRRDDERCKDLAASAVVTEPSQITDILLGL